jgi:hypothetical protein
MRKTQDKGKQPKDTEVKADEPNEPADVVIPVCLGEFGVDEARGFRRLWESIWGQDRRGNKENR